MRKRPQQYRFCLRHFESPTYFNLCKYLQEQGWQSTRFNWRSHFNEQHFQFHSSAAEYLEFKHLLARLVTQYCPHVMPMTYYIDDQNWPAVLGEVADIYYTQNQQVLDQINNLIWILKPSHLNNGKHIKIFQRLSDLEQHYLSSNRLGGQHVLQQYLTQPHLLRGHKYSIRMFVVLTNYAGAYLYPQGYLNVAQYPYQASEFADLSSHLTNEHLKEGEVNVIQIPSEGFDFFPGIYPQIKSIVTETINGLQKLYPQAFLCNKQRTLAVMGFDFMVDVNMRVWLLEANHGPCFPTSDEHPLQKYLYRDFWQAFIASFVLPIAVRQSVESIKNQLFTPLV